jgi:hypothetical protein
MKYKICPNFYDKRNMCALRMLAVSTILYDSSSFLAEFMEMMTGE